VLPVTIDEEQAARITGGVWQAVCVSSGPHAAAFRHFPAVFDAAWLAALPLPAAGSLPPGQLAAMRDPARRDFEHYTNASALRAAYEDRPRTRIIEDIGWGDDGTWAGLAGQHLTRLAGTGPRVTVTVYESAGGDEELDAHRDTWLGVIVQAAGVKTWRAGEGLTGLGRGGVEEVTMRAGDVLVLPKNMLHLVTTPPDPGRSVHLVFAFDRDLVGST
jgi:hypothetical protein